MFHGHVFLIKCPLSFCKISIFKERDQKKVSCSRSKGRPTSVAFLFPPSTIPSSISILLGRQHPPFLPTILGWVWAETDKHTRARTKVSPYIIFQEKQNKNIVDSLKSN